MIAVLAVLAMEAAAPAQPADGQALVAAVQASLDEVRARQARLPPPRNDAERLIRMNELDQAPRKVVTTFDWSTLSPAEREAAFRGQAAIMDASDHELLAQLLQMVPPEGWFLKSRYGEKAANAAFLIVQHADLDVQRRFLPKLEALAKTGEVDGQNYAGMFDRVAVTEKRAQRYGTQFRCDGGKWRPYPLEDEARVDALRREVGIPSTLAEMEAFTRTQPPCPQTPSPAPPGMKLD